MAKYFIEKSNINDNKIYITGDTAHHLVSVLRIKVGDELHLSDGEDAEYLCSVESLTKKDVVVSINRTLPITNESNLDVWLLQGIAKGDKMDFIIQKAVELGVNHICPVATEFCVVKIKDKADQKRERWQKIADGAASQCRRGRLPEVCLPTHLFSAIDSLPSDCTVIVLWENEDKSSLKTVLRIVDSSKPIAIVIGAEGGLSRNEVVKLVDNGASCVTLGPRILRTETASITALSAIFYELGDWGE